MELIKKRYAAAIRKFLAFEVAQGRKDLFPLYQSMLKQALADGWVLACNPFEKQAAKRLAQVGLMVERQEVLALPDGRKILNKRFELPCLKNCELPDEFPANSFWLQRRLTGVEVLRFYQMPSVAIEWILSDLEMQVVQFRDTDLAVHHWVSTNTQLISRIWKITLYQELTLAAEPPELADMAKMFSKAKDSSKRAHIPKEKLGLAKLPNVFQMRHIRATCHYMRKSAGL